MNAASVMIGRVWMTPPVGSSVGLCSNRKPLASLSMRVPDGAIRASDVGALENPQLCKGTWP